MICNTRSIGTQRNSARDERGTALIIVALSITVLLALFFLCFEVFLMLRSSIQANRDVRSSAFGAVARYLRQIDSQGGVDTSAIRSNSQTKANQIYASSRSRQNLGGNVGLSFLSPTGTPLPAGQVCTNWALDSRGLIHNFSGYQNVIGLAAQSRTPMSKQTGIAYKSKVIYDGRLGNKGLFPIVVQQ